jgi:O-antigen/teichoic acid export membrane protein
LSSDIIKRAGKAALWVSAAKWLDVIGSIVTLLFTARLLPPEAFGVYGMALLAILIPDTVLSGALTESLIQRKDLRPGHLNGAFLIHMILFAIFMAGLLLVTPLIVAHFGEPELAQIVPILSAAILFGCFGAVPGAILQRELRFGVISIGDAVSSVIAAVVGIGLAFAGFGIWSLIGMEVGRRFTKYTVFIAAARWLPSLKVNRADIADLMRFNLLTLLTRLLAQLDSAIPRFFIGTILGAQALGYFNMAFRLYQQISAVILAPFTAIALPVAAAVQHDRAWLHATFASGTRAATMLAFPVFIGAAAIAPVALPMLLGAQWTPVVVAAQILMLTAIRSPANAFNGEVLRGTGKPGLQLSIVTFGAILGLILAPVVTPYGIAWASAAVLFRGMLQWGLAAMIVERTLGYPASRQFTIGWESMAAAAVMGVAVLAVTPLASIYLKSGLLLGVLVLFGALVHISTLSVLAPRLARTLVGLGGAIVRRDRQSITRLLGLS